jgi:SAM-dependent methyltransferase
VRPASYRSAPPDDRPPPLEFLHGQIDPVVEEAAECALQPLLPHELLQVPVLAACQLQQFSVRARGLAVDHLGGEGQEVSLAVPQTLAQHPPSLSRVERMAQEGGEAEEKPCADSQLSELRAWSQACYHIRRVEGAEYRRPDHCHPLPTATLCQRPSESGAQQILSAPDRRRQRNDQAAGWSRRGKMPADRRRALEHYRCPHAGGFTSGLEPLARRAIERLRLRPGEVVLDVGCGTGRSFPFILSDIGAGGRLVGIDQSPEMLATARSRMERFGWQNVTFVQAPAEEAELAVRADAVLFLCTHDVVSSPRALGNTLQYLRPGGRVVAAGPMWSPWWALPANFYTWFLSRRYVTTLADYSQPWRSLARLISDLQVELVPIIGIIPRRGYVAWGTSPASQPA